MTATDSVTEGAAHLRNVKKALLASFPAFVGTTLSPKSVSLTEDQINDAALKTPDQTFAGVNTFAQPIIGITTLNANPDGAETINGPWTLANNAPLFGRDVADAVSYELVNINGVDQGEIGDVLLAMEWRGLSNRHFHGAEVTHSSTTQALGSVLIRQIDNTDRKVGFRNPAISNVDTSRALAQDDEGKIIVVNGGGDNPVIFTLDTLDPQTTCRFITNQAARLVLGTVVTLRFYDGSGAFVDASVSGVDIAGGSVVELWYQGTTTAVIFGNGITVI